MITNRWKEGFKHQKKNQSLWFQLSTLESALRKDDWPTCSKFSATSIKSATTRQTALAWDCLCASNSWVSSTGWSLLSPRSATDQNSHLALAWNKHVMIRCLLKEVRRMCWEIRLKPKCKSIQSSEEAAIRAVDCRSNCCLSRRHSVLWAI